MAGTGDKTVLTSPDGSETLEVPSGAGVRALQALGWELDTDAEAAVAKKAPAKKAAASKTEKKD